MHNFVVEKRKSDRLFMRHIYLFVTAIVALIALAACDSFHALSSTKKTAQGSPYEVLVVCDGQEWESPLGEEIRSVLGTHVEMINQEEPMFDIVRITARDFKHLLPSYRNILKVLCSPEVKEPAILAQYDVVASPQIVLTFQGPSIEAMVAYLKENGANLLRVLEIAERDRTIALANSKNVNPLEAEVKRIFDIDMKIPAGYLLRGKGSDFIWASNEYPAASQGFFIYTHPFYGEASLTTEALVKARSNFVKRIPGPVDGSHMTTVTSIPNIENDGYDPFMPDRKVVRINGRDWIELRGFWDVTKDFMGGPFVSYTTLDKRSGKLITLDCYVYSPKYGKRNFLRPLEHLVYCISFPTNETTK